MLRRLSNRKKKQVYILILSTILLLLLAGCSSWYERLWLRAPGWSRGALVGETSAVDPAPIVFGEDGSLYLLAVEDHTAGGYALRIKSLTRDGQVQWERSVDVEGGRPDQPALLWQQGHLKAFWISSQSLYSLTLSPTGEVLGDLTQLSGDEKVGYFHAALENTGELVLWYSGPRSEPGVYAFPIGDLAAGSVLVDEYGIRPKFQTDLAGTTHIIWVRYPTGFEREQFLYTEIPLEESLPGQALMLLDTQIPLTKIMHGPAFGVDGFQGYLHWSVESRTGPSAGDIVSYLLTFPLDLPGIPSNEIYFRLPTTYNLPYGEFPSITFESGERVDLSQEGLPRSARVMDLRFIQGQSDETVALARIDSDYLRRKTSWQIGSIYFSEGLATSYQLLSFTPSQSVHPYIISDPDGALYMTWLERGQGTQSSIYYASTEPDVVQTLGEITSGDVSQIVAETLFGMASGVVLIPMGLVWMLASVIIIGVTGWMRKEDQPILAPGTLASILLAIAAFWATKLFIFPTLFSYVPFSAWIPLLPDGIKPVLRYSVPILISLIAVLIAYRYTYGRQQRSALFFTLIYGMIDGLLTLAIYGVIFWGDI
jgi:hypothetical protein